MQIIYHDCQIMAIKFVTAMTFNNSINGHKIIHVLHGRISWASVHEKRHNSWAIIYSCPSISFFLVSIDNSCPLLYHDRHLMTIKFVNVMTINIILSMAVKLFKKKIMVEIHMQLSIKSDIMHWPLIIQSQLS